LDTSTFGKPRKGTQLSNNPTVVARNLKKSYYLNRTGSEHVLSKKLSKHTVEAVKDVSFVAYSGESIGILGKNGSGKSTLLRMIAGSSKPDSGDVFVSSQPTLLGVGAALQSSLSGRQNINLGLLAMGLTPAETSKLVDPIIDWADLRSAIDRPLKTYSSGMRSRLTFAISTAVRRELLLIDEALSTGDSTFKAKAKDRMDEFLNGAGTVFLVSHGAATIQTHCSRAIWLHEGHMIADGDAETVTTTYRVWGNRVSTGKLEEADRIIKRQRKAFKPHKILLDSEAAKFLNHSSSAE